MKNPVNRKRIFNVLKQFFHAMSFSGFLYAFLLAGASDANMISSTRLTVAIIVCAAMMLVGMFAADYCTAVIKTAERQIQRKKRYVRTQNLFTLSFSELCEQFYKSGCANAETVRTGKVLGRFEWAAGSLNDNIRRWLVSNGIPYLNTTDGEIWFSETGKLWQTVECEVVGGNIVTLFERVPVFNKVAGTTI